jgi:hypothetical protein
MIFWHKIEAEYYTIIGLLRSLLERQAEGSQEPKLKANLGDLLPKVGSTYMWSVSNGMAQRFEKNWIGRWISRMFRESCMEETF